MTEERISTADIAAAANREEPFERPNGAARQEEQFTGPLLPEDFSGEMRSRWSEIQTGFVDDPRVAVQQADELVASAMKKLAETFAGERTKLEQQWDRGDNVSTEDLRVALRRYRAFFQRLLAV